MEKEEGNGLRTENEKGIDLEGKESEAYYYKIVCGLDDQGRRSFRAMDGRNQIDWNYVD